MAALQDPSRKVLKRTETFRQRATILLAPVNAVIQQTVLSDSNPEEYDISLPIDQATPSTRLHDDIDDHDRPVNSDADEKVPLATSQEIAPSERRRVGPKADTWSTHFSRFLLRLVYPEKPINPSDRWYRKWFCVIVALSVYTCWAMPFHWGFLAEDFVSFTLGFTSAAVSVLFLWEIRNNFSLVFQEKSTTVYITDRRAIARRYAQGYFVFDLLACVPWALISDYTGISMIGLVPVWFQLIRLRHIKVFFHRLSRDIRYNYFVVRIIATLLWEYFFVHIAACVFFFLAYTYPDPDLTWFILVPDSTAIGESSQEVNSAADFKDSTDVWRQYIVSLYWSVVTMAGVGYGDIHATNLREMVFAIIYICWDLLFMSWIIAEFTALVVREHSKTELLREKVSALIAFCGRRRVPARLKMHLQAHTVMQQLTAHKDDDVIQDFPEHLRRAVAVEEHVAVLKESYLFQGCSPEFLQKLCPLLSTEWFIPNESLCTQEEAWDQAYFILHGGVEVALWWPDGSFHAFQYSDGDVFGEMALLLPRVPIGRFSARTTATSKLLRLDRGSYMQVSTLHLADLDTVLGNFKLNWGIEDGVSEPHQAGSHSLRHSDAYQGRNNTHLGNLRVQEVFSSWGSTLETQRAQQTMSVMEASSKGDLGELRYLRQQGCDVTLASFDGRTALHLAAGRGYPEICQFLLGDGANVNQKDRQGVTPLLEALRGGNEQTITLLRRWGGLVLLESDAKELCQAVKAGKVEYMERLLDCGVDPNACDFDRRTPLHVAASESMFVVVRLLLEKGADPWLPDRLGNLPLDEACQSGCKPVIGLLSLSMRALGITSSSGNEFSLERSAAENWDIRTENVEPETAGLGTSLSGNRSRNRRSVDLPHVDSSSSMASLDLAPLSNLSRGRSASRSSSQRSKTGTLRRSESAHLPASASLSSAGSPDSMHRSSSVALLGASRMTDLPRENSTACSLNECSSGREHEHESERERESREQVSKLLEEALSPTRRVARERSAANEVATRVQPSGAKPEKPKSNGHNGPTGVCSLNQAEKDQTEAVIEEGSEPKTPPRAILGYTSPTASGQATPPKQRGDSTPPLSGPLKMTPSHVALAVHERELEMTKRVPKRETRSGPLDRGTPRSRGREAEDAREAGGVATSTPKKVYQRSMSSMPGGRGVPLDLNAIKPYVIKGASLSPLGDLPPRPPLARDSPKVSPLGPAAIAAFSPLGSKSPHEASAVLPGSFDATPLEGIKESLSDEELGEVEEKDSHLGGNELMKSVNLLGRVDPESGSVVQELSEPVLLLLSSSFEELCVAASRHLQGGVDGFMTRAGGVVQDVEFLYPGDDLYGVHL